MRATIAIIAGLIVWVLCATALNFVLRMALPGYAVAEPHMQFTLGMMIARLALPGGIPSIVAGFTSAWIARGRGRVVTILAVILLLLFLPSHYYLFDKFPLWYHLTFLTSLALLPACGGYLGKLVVKNRLTPP